jgi:hypothetical protein
MRVKTNKHWRQEKRLITSGQVNLFVQIRGLERRFTALTPLVDENDAALRSRSRH